MDVETAESLNTSINSAKKHYSSMFFLPSYQKSLIAMAAVCLGGVSLCGLALFTPITSLALGLTLFLLTLGADTLIIKTVLRGDLIFSGRRITAMSCYCWLLWLAFIAIGVGLGFLFGWLLWVKLTLIGFAAVVTLRVMVFSATSYAAMWRQAVSALLTPVFGVIAFLAFWVYNSTVTFLQVLPYVVFAPIVCYVAVFSFLWAIDRLGRQNYSLPTLPMFKAFLLNWVTDLNAPLEKYLEQLGENADIEVNLLKFDSVKPKAAIIMPLVHPGPFKNIGSSLLPSMLKSEFEREFACTATTPLGILGHELDLASQAQNHRIVSQVISSARFPASAELASPFVKVTEGAASACCQIFGDTALLSFSLAPKTTEDMPQELGRAVDEEAQQLGLRFAMVVNAHNSINDVEDTDVHLAELKAAASKCLQKAVAQQKKPYRVGAATVYPKEFTLKAGMGTGGITAIVVEVDGQKTAYVVVDGNNMVSGLREKVLASLTALGFSESEVFTTDSHAVSALVTGRRGYHPVGEVMDQDVLTRYIGEAAKQAETNLEAAKAGFSRFVVPQVRVIGEERLNSLMLLVDKAIVRAKKIAFPIFGAEGLVLILLLLLF